MCLFIGEDPLAQLVERIVYDLETREVTIHYQISGVNVASPRDSHVAPSFQARIVLLKAA